MLMKTNTVSIHNKQECMYYVYYIHGNLYFMFMWFRVSHKRELYYTSTILCKIKLVCLNQNKV